MISKYGLSESETLLGNSVDCAAAHRGFGKYFQLRYRQAYETWQHARLVPGLRKYFKDEGMEDCWEVVNSHLKW